MSNITRLSFSRKTASFKKFIISGIIGTIQVSNSLLHSLSGVGSTCRHEETCSAYAIRTLQEKGILKGSMLSLRRVLNCQPFFRI